ncbi:tryptophan synthase subunit alpha [Canibacter zhoujuaniae]|uniref:tryptophan synthase subunit alpha n=1 Tax=Canibacter zhoujuaniae TaxID=2708343 RepID=UPI0014230D36|nr:tryptophan synthase subunit alpha [Canibacter zhoujuaniae]
MSRVTAAIEAAQAAGRAALVGYLPLGFPDIETSVAAAVTLVESGADIIELGPPYSDPVMDGAVIQEATTIALQNGFRVRDIFPAIKAISERVAAPILVMSYWNLILQYGVDRFAADLRDAGGAGLITPDITPEFAGEWIAAAEKYDLDRVFLAAQTSTDERLQLIAENSRGFVYAVSTMGITGAREELDAAAESLVQRLRAAGAKHVCVGIGITNAAHVKAVAGYADGAIVGTALVKALRDGGIDRLSSVAAELATGTKRLHNS